MDLVSNFKTIIMSIINTDGYVTFITTDPVDEDYKLILTALDELDKEHKVYYKNEKDRRIYYKIIDKPEFGIDLRKFIGE
jgi:hypothetical protein